MYGRQKQNVRTALVFNPLTNRYMKKGGVAFNRMVAKGYKMRGSGDDLEMVEDDGFSVIAEESKEIVDDDVESDVEADVEEDVDDAGPVLKKDLDALRRMRAEVSELATEILLDMVEELCEGEAVVGDEGGLTVREKMTRAIRTRIKELTYDEFMEL